MFSTNDCNTPLAVDTKSVSSQSSRSNCSNVLASSVDCKPMTTHLPYLIASLASLDAIHRYLLDP